MNRIPTKPLRNHPLVKLPLLLAATLALDSNLVALPRQTLATRLYVAPNGNDAWSGKIRKPNRDRTDGPLASLAGARNAIRNLKSGDSPAAAVRVVVADGLYFMEETFELVPEDGGAASAPIVYQAAPDAKPVFSGGRSVTGWRPRGDGLWETKVPQVRGTNSLFEQLWVNGRRAQRARSPNEFFYYVYGKVKDGPDWASGRRIDWRKQAFRAQPDDIRPLLSLAPAQLSNVTVAVYHSWEVSRHRIARIDPTNAILYFTGPAYWPFARWGNGQRYYIENFKQALDSAGEWYLDADGTLYYRPLPGEDMRKAEVIAPLLQPLVHFKGEPSKGRFVENIVLDGLTFRHGQYILPPSGNSDPQAALWVPAAIMLDGARRVTIRNGEISRVGTYAVWFREGCSDCLLQRMLLTDLGAGGVKIGEQFARRDMPGRTARITVDNCIIRDGGFVHAGAVGVWIGQSGENLITHNEISDLLYTGVSVGWMWDYGRSLAFSNRVEFNHIHDLGKRVLSDLGGIYTLGICTGTVLCNNVIHDVDPYDLYGAGGFGIYLDAASSGIRVENNLTYRTKHGGFHLNFGRDNVVLNNIFALGRDDQLRLSVADSQHCLTFHHNVIYARGGRMLQGQWREAKLRHDNNLYWDAGTNALSFAGMKLDGWRKLGRDSNSLIADPAFVAPDRNDFRLRPGSPAFRVGFKPFDPGLAGVYGDRAWRRLAARERRSFAPPPSPPPPPPLSLEDGFEDTALGGRPEDATVYMEFRGESVAVTNELAATGKQCLKITDAPGLEKAFLPLFFYVPNHRSGSTHVEFDLRLGAGALLAHEWRDAANPYATGPSLKISNGRLEAAGRELAALPENEWVHLAIDARLRQQGSSLWSLAITRAGATPRVFTNLPARSPNWRELQWLGFLSYATNHAAFWIDNLAIENRP